MVAKSKFVGNLFHRTIRGEEQQLGAFHLFTVDVLNRCLGKFLLEKPDEVGLGDGCHNQDWQMIEQRLKEIIKE